MKTKKSLSAIVCLVVVVAFFSLLGYRMGIANMLNTVMQTAFRLLLDTVFYLMGICVIMGAISKLFVEFGVVDLLERVLRPLMKPLFNLPGVASLGAVMTFFSDNPAIISLSKDRRFSSYFKKYQFISLTNFGTAFGMGLIVIVFMVGRGYSYEPFIGLFGAFCGCIVSTRLMQRFIVKAYPAYATEDAVGDEGIGIANPDERKQPQRSDIEIANPDEQPANPDEQQSVFLRTLNALLDGGRNGVEIGLAIIPGVLIISSLVMVLTFGASADGNYTGSAFEGVELLPWLANKFDWLFAWLFGLSDPHQIAFPITALGAVGAALGLVPNFQEQGWIDGNAIAVFTAIGMCWSGFLSTHTAMLDSLGYRQLTSKALISHTIGGIAAAFVAHWTYVLVSMVV